MNGYDMICEAAKTVRTTRMPEAADIPAKPLRPGSTVNYRDKSVERPEFDDSDEYRDQMGAAMDNTSTRNFKKLIPGSYWEASGSPRSDGKSSQDRDGGNRYDTSTPERRRKALAAARRSDNPEDLRKLRGKVAESCLLPQIYPREAVSSGDFPDMAEVKGQLPPWMQKDTEGSTKGAGSGRNKDQGDQPRKKRAKKDAKVDESSETVEEAPLNAKRRNALPGKDFAGPDRSYPVDTPARARAALSRARANDPALYAKIRAKVKRMYPSMDVK